MLDPISKIIDTIKTENSKIDTIFEEMTKKVKKIKKFNNELIQLLKIFKSKITLELNQILQENFINVDNWTTLNSLMSQSEGK